MNRIDYGFDRNPDRHNTYATKYEELAEKYGRTDLLPLWIADMDFATPAAVTGALRRRFGHDAVLGYTHATADFWTAITEWLRRRHGCKAERCQLDFIPGVKKGLGLCVNYFTSPGDAIVIQPPVYHSFRSVIEGNGRRAVDNPLILENGNYRMDLDGLSRIMGSEKPRMMILCNPHNPIGVQWDADTLARVAALCREHGVVLLSDEIYGDLILDGGRHVPTAEVSADAAGLTVTLGAPSKTFNIPGIASAWMRIVNPTLRDGFFKWLLASEFDTPPLCAVTATVAAYNECGEWLDAALAYIADNADHACRRIAERMPGVSAVKPQAGFGLWIDFSGTGIPHTELSRRLIEEARLAVSDGPTFGPGGENCVRLNIATSREVLDEALNRIESIL